MESQIIRWRAKRLIMISLCFFVLTNLIGQGRSYVKEQIQQKGQCRNVAITKTNGDLMLYGRNGCSRSGCPEELNNAIVKLNSDGEYIDDIQLTEQGSWLILYGTNGFSWFNIPSDLESSIRSYNSVGEVVNSVTFNDVGDWIVITESHFSTSDSRITEWLKEGELVHGELWAACVTDDAIVAVYARGYKFLGDVPESLKEALHTSSLDVYRLKIAGDSWFFADKNGAYRYYM